MGLLQAYQVPTLNEVIDDSAFLALAECGFTSHRTFQEQSLVSSVCLRVLRRVRKSLSVWSRRLPGRCVGGEVAEGGEEAAGSAEGGALPQAMQGAA